MKKYILGIIVIAIIAGFYSCKKDNTGQAISEQENEMMLRSKKVILLIQQFDAKMHSTFKSGELIDIDSAVWNMEALQNYDYAYPDSSTKEFVHNKSYYTIPVDANNKVLMSDVQVVNGLMEDTLLYQLSQFPEEVKCMKFWDVTTDSIVGRTAFLSAIGGYGRNLTGPYYGFDEDDDWFWGTLSQEYGQPPLGKCDGTMVGISDGSDELQWRLNNPVFQSGNPIYFFTDLVTLETTGFDWDDVGGVYPLYVGWDYPEDNCLSDVMLTDYLMNSDWIINTFDYDDGLRPAGLTFESVYIKDDLLIANPPSHLHYYFVTYGIPSYIPPPN